MRPRQKIIEMFSTFVELEGDRFSKWLIDIKLHRNIQNCLEYSPFVPNSENFWALHWYKCWQEESNSLARMHLSSYLQEPNYWAAKKTIAKFTNSQHNLADYFQMANAEIETILKNFNPEKCSSLKAYATMAVPSRLKDILRHLLEKCLKFSFQGCFIHFPRGFFLSNVFSCNCYICIAWVKSCLSAIAFSNSPINSLF